jgi:hypothetical protein
MGRCEVAVENTLTGGLFPVKVFVLAVNHWVLASWRGIKPKDWGNLSGDGIQ